MPSPPRCVSGNARSSVSGNIPKKQAGFIVIATFIMIVTIKISRKNHAFFVLFTVYKVLTRRHIMQNLPRIISASTLIICSLVAAPAHGQMAVSDAANYAQAIQDGKQPHARGFKP